MEYATRPRVSLVVSFTGTLNDKLRGFYRSTFKDDAGTEHVIATTQMQATDCRQRFRAGTSPTFKATFRHHARHRPGADDVQRAE